MTATSSHKEIMPYQYLKTFFSARELLWAWTSRTIQARYKQSILGGLWAIIQPAARALLLTVIFTKFIPVDTGAVPYVIFSYVAMVPWMFFSTSITDMVECLVNNMNLVSKIYFPREVLPVAALLARLFDLVIASVLMLLLMIYYHMQIFTLQWLFIPVILVIQIALTLGLGLIGAALNVFYRDVYHLFAFVLQLLFYAVPIIYPVSKVPESIRDIYMLNPISAIIEAYRSVILHNQLPGVELFRAIPIALLLLLIGYWLFKRLEFYFADVI